MYPLHAVHSYNFEQSIGLLALDSPNPPPESTNRINLLISIDNSGSMGDTCHDGKSKMDHAKHMLTRLVKYLFQYPNIEGTLSIVVFDHDIQRLCMGVPLNNRESVYQLLSKISHIESIGGTDIGQPLQIANEWVLSLPKQEGTNVVNAHIFMTDGQATYGIERTEELITIPQSNYTSYYIGFGVDHHFSLMRGLGNLPNSDYYFVESIEKAGMVYGEVLHRILYSIPQDIEIICSGGKLYDYQSNEWKNRLSLQNVARGTIRLLHTLADSDDQTPSFEIHIGDDVCGSQLYAHDNPYAPSTINTLSTKIAKIRQTVLEYLFQCINSDRDSKIELTNKSKEIAAEIKAFMQVTNQLDNVVVKQLLDDVEIARRGLECGNGRMFIGARQSSCGQQRAYSVVDIEAMTPVHPHTCSGFSHLRPPATPTRNMSFAALRHNKSKSVPPPLSEEFTPPVIVGSISPTYTPSAPSQSCYASPSQSLLMQELSGKLKLDKYDVMERT